MTLSPDERQASTARSVPEWIGSSPDAKVPLRVRLRIFEREGARCWLSGRKIMPGDIWELDHKVALINGGEHRESNLAPAIQAFHIAKTAEDVKLKSKIARTRAKHLGVWPKAKRPLKSRGFEKRGDQ